MYRQRRRPTYAIDQLLRDRPIDADISTLHYRRIRGDMIETYKILTGKYDIETAPYLVGVCSSITRGDSMRLQKRGQNMIYASSVLLIE